MIVTTNISNRRRRALEKLADSRAARMITGRPIFNLTDQEAAASAASAMRLAGGKCDCRENYGPDCDGTYPAVAACSRSKECSER